MIDPATARGFACELLQAMADNDDIAVRAYFLGVRSRLDRDLVAAHALGIAGGALRDLAQLDGVDPSEVIARLAGE